MTKLTCVLAILAAAVSTSAAAKELKRNKHSPTVSATQTTDSKRDKVAGSKMDKVAASTLGRANNNGRLGGGIDGVWW